MVTLLCLLLVLSTVVTIAAGFCLHPSTSGVVVGTVTRTHRKTRTFRKHHHQHHRRPDCCGTLPSFVTATTTTVLASTNNNEGRDNASSSGTGAASVSTTTSITHPWRIVMDIGREPLARMPFNWARQGVRMPLVTPTDFGLSTSGGETKFLTPRAETVSFTGPGGAQESPILGNGWSVSDDFSTLSASFIVTNELRKRDVVIEANTELILETQLYTQTELDRLNEEYYKAREAMWSTGENLNDTQNKQESPRKWNPKTERWEQRYPDENPIKMLQNKVQYWMQNAQQEKAKSQRPEPDSLSDRGGRLPGVGVDDEYVYLVQQGVVRYGGDDGPVCGTWKAQPITNAPAWERGR